MADGHDISGSDDEVVWEPDTELYPLELDGSDGQYLQLNRERSIWTREKGHAYWKLHCRRVLNNNIYRILGQHTSPNILPTALSLTLLSQTQMNRVGKLLKKEWSCFGGEYNKIIWSYQLG